MTDAYELGELRESDAESLGRAHCRIWEVTYADLMTPEAHARLEPGRFIDSWRARARTLVAEGHLPRDERIVVARHQGEAVGFISTGRSRDEDPPVALELWALNVLPEHQGTGVAQRMIAHALEGRDAYLWVARGNDRAIRFYRRQGFLADGHQSTRNDGIVELRMVRVQSAGTNSP